MSTMTPVLPVAPAWAPAAWLRGLCALMIKGYQRWLSPHKGYCCAHRVLHKGESCSQYVKRAVIVGGVRQAWTLAMRRFAACGRASRALERRRQREATLAQRIEERTQRTAEAIEDAPDTIEATVDLIEAAPDLMSAAGDTLSAAFEATGRGLEAGGQVLANGVDVLGSGCEVLGGFAECAGGCAI